MYLKSMITSGFKSFADKIEIDFTKGITGIVGPNGSGKSNVVDAVRWVLGEQSVKSLRGEGNMTDVIFSGSKSRNPMNVASVTLVFDNLDKYLPIEYDEVAIRRRLYKDGTNEYSINNERCRLKDVLDLLMDSGMAKESFNIISQGKIEEIISDKPSERRIIFEEAARVSKYKKRKVEALRKLERTHDNMNRVNDIIIELENQVGPLKEMRNQALLYNELKTELETVEVALITSDITSMNFKYQQSKKRIAELNKELLSMTTENSTQEAKIEEYKKEINKLDFEISRLQKNNLEKATTLEKINSEKNILLERKKYEVEDQKLHSNLVELKEQSLKLTSAVNTVKEEIKYSDIKVSDYKKDLNDLELSFQKIKDKKATLEQKLTQLVRAKSNLEIEIRRLSESIDSSSSLPYSVRTVLNNPKLSGILNAIGNIIEVDEKYSLAITTSLGYATSYVVTENEISATTAINYLKGNNIGRVTFFPLNIIKAKYIEDTIINNIKNATGFIGIASSLVKYDKKYTTIIENQLGNVIVVDNINNGNKISKLINYRYRIITIDGEVIHTGGSLTGGNGKPVRSVITEKYELENSIKELDSLNNTISLTEEEINKIDNEYRNNEDKIYLLKRDILTVEEIVKQKNILISELNDKLNIANNEMNGTNNILNNSLSKEEETILKNYYIASEEVKKVNLELESVSRKRSDLNSKLEDYEFSLRRENSSFNTKNKELKELEIDVSRMDVKLDNLLNKLNETYEMTYEKAVTMYELKMEEEEARNKVSVLRKTIKDLGIVNVGAIEEYDRVNERYEFLSTQKNDLKNAEDILLDIIKEMDEVMVKEFTETFKDIKENFEITFKELFKGGHATLKMTDPSNVLETGIEIIASPPGKKLTSISLLSGGEKTFTAISLLFAILKSRPVPFSILDEVEAALDEVNVDSFGKYLISLKEKTQFILITHKKRTMEYVDNLYGITMQESGVSKLVSVKLDENIVK